MIWIVISFLASSAFGFWFGAWVWRAMISPRKMNDRSLRMLWGVFDREMKERGLQRD